MPLERQGRWRRWVSGLLSAAVCTLVGTLLVAAPWLPSWDQNYFSGSQAGCYAIWTDSYFRGAVSGLGALNLYISFVEVLALVRGGGRSE